MYAVSCLVAADNSVVLLPKKYDEQEANTLQARLREELQSKGGKTKCIIAWGQKKAL